MAELPGTAFHFRHRLRVRYSEVDPQWIVYHSRYLEYMDTAMTEYMRSAGLDYTAMVAAGFDPALINTTVEFRAPARFDDLLDVYAGVLCIGSSSLTMGFPIQRAEDNLEVVSAKTVYVNFDCAKGVSKPVPVFARDAMIAFESARTSDVRSLTNR